MIKTFTGEDKEYAFPKMTEYVPLVFGRVLDFRPKVHELKMFDGKREVHSEEEALNKAIMEMRTHEFWENPVLQPVFELFFGHTMPMAPFPAVEGCLALNPQDSQLTIKEGMAIMSYDYKVGTSNTNCLFNMGDNKLKLEAKKLQRNENSPINLVGKQLEKMLDLAGKSVFGKLPPLDIPSVLNDPTIQSVIKLATDDKVQKQVKEGIENIVKVGEQLT